MSGQLRISHYNVYTAYDMAMSYQKQNRNSFRLYSVDLDDL